MIETHAGAFVGDCGLTMQEVEGEWLVEVGWHVRSDMRRQGYAAEAGRANLFQPPSGQADAAASTFGR